MALLYNQTIHSNDSDDADGFPRGSVMNARRLLSPVYEDAGLGEHQEPEVPFSGFGGEAVVNQHAPVRKPFVTRTNAFVNSITTSRNQSITHQRQAKMTTTATSIFTTCWPMNQIRISC